MRSRGRSLLLLLLAVLAGFPVVAGEDPPAVLPHEPLDVAPSRPRPAAHYRRVEALVARLAELDEWQENGLSLNSGGGMGFDPGDAGTDPATCTAAAAFGALAALGPDAMPALLAHLDDGTPTKLTCSHTGGFGAMWFATEIGVNPAAKDELAAIRTVFPRGWSNDPFREEDEEHDPFPFHGPPTHHHRVTIGDCCYALLGQITNRVYEAVRYQPTACNVVVSPTRDARIARAIRAQWAGKDFRVELARRLVADLHTTRSELGRSWDGYRQASAGARLATYYPEESEARLAALVERREPEDEGDAEALCVHTAEFVRWLCRSERPAVLTALWSLGLRTRGIDVLDAIVERFGDRAEEALFDRIVLLVRESVRRDQRRWVIARLLRELHRRWPERLGEVVVRDLPGTREIAQIFSELAYCDGIDLPVRVWVPWLDETCPAVTWTSGGTKHIERLRLCDVAALSIARQRDDLTFDERADEAARDEQIRVIRRAIADEGPR